MTLSIILTMPSVALNREAAKARHKRVSFGCASFEGSVEKNIKANAEMAIQQLRPISGIDFGYNRKSVEWLEGFIKEIREAGEMGHDEEKDRLVSVLGSFLGECVIRCYGGVWAYRDGVWCIAFDNGNFAFPFAKVEKQMDNGLEESIGSFFRAIPVAFEGHVHPQPSATEKPWWKFW